MKLTARERVALRDAAMVVQKAGFVFLTDQFRQPWGHDRADEVSKILFEIADRSSDEEAEEGKEKP